MSRFWERKLGYDDDGYERREACLAIADCPRCGKEIELVAETEAWTLESDGRWHHSEYSPAAGVCCGVLIVDSFDGCHCYELPEAAS